MVYDHLHASQWGSFNLLPKETKKGIDLNYFFLSDII